MDALVTQLNKAINNGDIDQSSALLEQIIDNKALVSIDHIPAANGPLQKQESVQSEKIAASSGDHGVEGQQE
jgi:hypothetical protein